MIIKYFFIIWIVLFFGGIGTTIWLIYYMIKKRRTASHKEIKKKLTKDINKKAPNLSKHESHDIYHLYTSESSYLVIDGLSSNRAKGVLRGENNQKFLYYSWIDPIILSSKFQLLAKTSSKIYYVRMLKNTMVFMVNNSIIGFHQVHSGLFFNKEKEVIGQINTNYGNAPIINKKYGQLNFDLFRENSNDNYPVEFLSGTKALITNKSNTYHDLAIRLQSEHTTTLEKDILTAYAIQYIIFTDDRRYSDDSMGDDYDFDIFDFFD